MVPEPPPTPPTSKRENLNELLVFFLNSRNVYFQPDENTKMQYPAIVYEVDGQDTIHADNKPHRRVDRYQVTVIDRNPDVPARLLVETLPMCTFNRAFARDGLNHRIYTLYF